MSHIARGLCVCVLVKPVSCTEMAEPTEMPLGRLTPVGPRKNYYIGVNKKQFWGFVRPMKSTWESLLQHMQQKGSFNPQ